MGQRRSFSEVASIVQVTISHIPCMNTYFLFSGQVLGGGGVIPITIPWSCKQKPTPTPTLQSRPTPKIKVPTSTPVATSIPRPTPTITTPPTPAIPSISQSNPPNSEIDTS